MASRPELLPIAKATLPLFVGIDLGGTNVKAALVDDRGLLVGFHAEPTHASRGPEDAAARRVIDAIDLVHTPGFIDTHCHGDPLETEILQGDTHRRRHARCIGAFALDAIELVATPEQEVDLGTLVGRPEPDVVMNLTREHLLDHEAFPGCSYFRVPQQGLRRVEA